MKSSSYTFQINKCVNDTHPDVICKQPDQINQFIKDIEIGIFKQEPKMDFSSYSVPPTFKITSPVASDILTSSKTIWINMTIRKNFYKLKDTYL